MKGKTRLAVIIIVAVCLAAGIGGGIFGIVRCSGCAKCTHVAVVDEAIAATCTSEGKTEGKQCAKCGEIIVAQEGTPIDPNAHDYVWTVDEAATCTVDGTRSGVCRHNGEHTTTEAIPAAHTPAVDEAVAASCLEAGKTEGSHCSVCDTVIVAQQTVKALGHELVVDEAKSKAATCTTHGEAVKHCVRENCTYEVKEPLKSPGHRWNREQTCEQGQQCEACGATTPSLGHQYEIVGAPVAMTCTTDGVTHYACARAGCSAAYDETTPHTGHMVATWTRDEGTKTGCEIEYELRGDCTNAYCVEQTVIRTETVEDHAYQASITTFATCVADSGVKTYACKDCDASYTERYTDPNAHEWEEATAREAQGATRYACTHCEATKRVLSHDGLTADALQGGGEVALEHATVALDSAAADSLGTTGAVQISVDTTTSLDDLGLTEEQKAQIDGTLYDFSLTANGTAVSDFGDGGNVTVTIPYTLRPGDDPDYIAVWYIDDSGAPEAFRATYSEKDGAGYVTFTTNHFSIYTVTRLDPQERCALYGHNMRTVKKVETTCTVTGYEQKVCTRCGRQEHIAGAAAAGHTIVPTVKSAATCTAQGVTEHECTNDGCTYGYTVVAPALGHVWKGETTAATCTAAGHVDYTCTRCDEKYVKTLTQLQHNYREVKTAATCTNGGYSTFTCTACAYSYVGNFKSATGHSYAVSVVAPTCTADGYTLHACVHCDDRYKTDTVGKAHAWDIEQPTCGSGQTCLVCGAAGKPATGEHSMADGVCTACGAGCEHRFTETTVEPTCTERGYTLKNCSTCGVSEKTDFTDARGHVGTVKCSRCGENMLPADFFKTALDSLCTGQLAIGFSDVEIVVEGEGATNVVIDFAELYVSVDENGNLYAYGQGVYETVAEDLPTVITGAIKAVIRDGYLYAQMQMPFGSMSGSENGQSQFSNANTTNCVVMPLESAVSSMMGSGQQMAETINAVLSWLNADLLPVLEAVEVLTGEQIAAAADRIVGSLFSMEKLGSGYKLAFDFTTLPTLNDNLYEHTLAENVDILLGEGGYAKLTAKILDLVDSTVDEIGTYALDRGLSLGELIEAADVLVGKLMDGATLNDVLSQMLNKEINILSYLTDPELKQTKLLAIVNAVLEGSGMGEQLGIEGGITPAWIESQLAAVGAINLYEMLAQMMGGEEPLDPAALKANADAVIKALVGKAELSVYTDGTGAIDRIAIGLNGFAMAGLYIDGTVTVTTAEKAADFLAFADELQAVYNDVAVTEQVVQALFSSATIDAYYGDGADKTVKQVHGQASGVLDRRVEAIGSGITVERITTIETSYTAVFDERQALAFTYDCGSWVQLQIQAKYTETRERRHSVALRLNGEEIGKDDARYQQVWQYVLQYMPYIEEWLNEPNEPQILDDVRMFGVWYNALTHRYETLRNDMGPATKHNYVSVGTPKAPVGCTGWGEQYFSCTECGHSYTLYVCNGHNYEQKVTLKPGATDCRDGIAYTRVCTVCHAESPHNWHKGEAYEHMLGVAEVIDLDEYGVEEQLIVFRCACGQSYETRQNAVHVTQRNGEVRENVVYEYGKETVGSLTIYTFENGFTLSVKAWQDDCTVKGQITFDCDGSGAGQDTRATTFGKSHSGRTFYRLQDGASTCDDGVIGSIRCIYCDYAVSRIDEELNGHVYGVLESIDLTPYGAKCGERLLIEGCACGAHMERIFWKAPHESEYDPNSHDPIVSLLECDVQATEIWRKAEDDYDNFTMLVKCAVTDPKCDLTFAVKYYSVENDCAKYMDILLGCDDKAENAKATKTYMYRYDHAWGELTDKRPEAGSTCYFVADHTCAKCGKTEIGKRYHEPPSETDWQQVRPDSCSWVKTCTACGEETARQDRHALMAVQEATCSQPGIRACANCRHREYEEPHHPWGERDEQTGLYTCEVCGLQNANGQSGEIILEEISDPGAETLVVGYFMRQLHPEEQDYERIGVRPYVLITWQDDKSETHRLLVDVMPYRSDRYGNAVIGRPDGNYVAFARAEVENWVRMYCEQNGETIESYQIMLTFTADDPMHNLEYAITFD